MPSGSSQPRGAQGGFTYLALLFAVVVLGIALSAVGVVWSTQSRRDKESQLLFVGDQYRLAIERYRASGGVLPTTLADLVEDKRTTPVRRHLRHLYPDPMTGEADWELIHTTGEQFIGVASRSTGKPIKVAGFAKVDASFEKAESYSDWRFIAATGLGAARRSARTQPAR
jgi:type II secretory pathway pseudopilin PulG